MLIKPYTPPPNWFPSLKHYNNKLLEHSADLQECTQKSWVLIQSLLRLPLLPHVQTAPISKCHSLEGSDMQSWAARGNCGSDQTGELFLRQLIPLPLYLLSDFTLACLHKAVQKGNALYLISFMQQALQRMHKNAGLKKKKVTDSFHLDFNSRKER